MSVEGGWIADVDLRKYFDTIDHGRLREFLQRRVRDGVLLRLIGKWLNAGVLEEGELSYPGRGDPPGRGGQSPAGQHLPALRAGRVVRGGGQAPPGRPCGGDPLRGRFPDRVANDEETPAGSWTYCRGGWRSTG